MPQTAIDRSELKAELRAALALEGKTLGDFAKECEVSRPHFDFVMAGERESPRIDALIEARVLAFRAAVRARGKRVGA